MPPDIRIRRVYNFSRSITSKGWAPHSPRPEETMTQRQAVFPAGRHALYETHSYSAAIRSGDLLFVSGQVGSRPDGSPEPDFNKQVQLAFDNLIAVLAAAGCTLQDIV